MNKEEYKDIRPKRGETWLIKFKKTKEDCKHIRPCLIISNDVQNSLSKRIVVAIITTEELEKIEPFEVFIKNNPEDGLDEPSKILLSYPRVVHKKRLKNSHRLGRASKEIMEKVRKAWEIAFNWDDLYSNE